MLDGAEYSSSASECFVELNDMGMPKRKKYKNNKRRFSDDQIRSLEVSFESDTKLEPRKKAQLAKELGLQPRQVAIWFQNKRARWKSKQIEKDYAVLLSDYNNLASQFESLKKEKQSLLIELQKLKNEMAGRTSERKNQSQTKETAENNNTDVESDYTNIDLRKSLEGKLSDDDRSIKAEFLGLDDENELLKMVEDSSLTSSEDWGSLDSDDLMNQGTESCQWWDFWC